MYKFFVALAVLLFSCSTDNNSGWQDLSNKGSWQFPKGINVNIVGNEFHLMSSKFNKKSKRKADQYHLMSTQQYKDFIFEAEVLVDSPKGALNSKTPLSKKAYGNTGVFIRGFQQTPYLVTAYQYEVDPSPRAFSGGLYIQDGKRKWVVPKYTYKSKDNKYYIPIEKEAIDFKRNFGKLYKPGKWNKIKIICQGDNIKFFINGVQTVDFNDSDFKSGYIALQHHGEVNQTYKFRNLRILKN